MFRPATKARSRARIALDGVAGAGKTMTALRAAAAFGNGKYPRVAVINTESGAVEKYLGLTLDGVPITFDVCELPNFAPTSYTAAIKEAGKRGYDVLIIDSLTHAWQGKDGALEQVSKKGGNSFTAWKDVTPQHNELVEAIIQSTCHVIATMRSKTEYILEESTNSQGKAIQVPKRVGMAPIQRQGMEYEFDIVGDLDLDHTLKITKTRCPEIDGAIVVKPGASFWLPVVAWLNDGGEAPPMAGSKAIEPGTMGFRAAVAATTAANGSGRTDPRNGPELDKPTAQATPPAANGPATEQQVKEINRLIVVLGMPEDLQAKSKAKRSIDRWDQLAFGDANGIIDTMREWELGFKPVPWERQPVAAGKGADDSAPFDA